jgi:hypothetical protein
LNQVTVELALKFQLYIEEEVRQVDVLLSLTGGREPLHRLVASGDLPARQVFQLVYTTIDAILNANTGTAQGGGAGPAALRC